MFSSTRHRVRHTSQGLFALMAGTWLLVAAAPCVMAAAPLAPSNFAGCCPDKSQPAANCDALAALDCQLPNPTPPSAMLDLPAPTWALLYTLPTLALNSVSEHAPPPARAQAPPLTLTAPHLNRKQTRLLI